MISKTVLLTFLLASLSEGAPNKRPRVGAGSGPFLPPKPYISGGEKVKGREFPYVVSLRMNGQHICGGTILNNQAILTSAHCGIGQLPSVFKVVTGSNLLSKGGSKHDVVDIIIHEDFSLDTSTLNDICIMRVTPNITLENGTSSVSLDGDTSDPSDGTDATVVGWGNVSMWGDAPDELRKVTIPITNRTKCQQEWGGGAVIGDTQICAGESGDKGPCNGDTGGPLIITANSTQIGIFSFGKPCTGEEHPTSVFTKVPDYIGWIKSHINN